jgi:hypothetical protein
VSRPVLSSKKEAAPPVKRAPLMEERRVESWAGGRVKGMGTTRAPPLSRNLT